MSQLLRVTLEVGAMMTVLWFGSAIAAVIVAVGLCWFFGYGE